MVDYIQYPYPTLRDRIRLALREDLGADGDITSAAVFPAGTKGRAVVVAKEHGIFAGRTPFAMCFEEAGLLDITVIRNGTKVSPGDEIARIKGNVRGILAAERTALNFIQRLSGIATLTAAFVRAAGGRLRVYDTRKTTPLWRDMEKMAVFFGGGRNHRMGLHDMVMLKDTHADGAGSLAEALRRVSHLRGDVPIAAEARNLDEVRQAIGGGADLLMLDNMAPEELREALALARGRVETEITGGVTLENMAEVAALGVDRVSIGALTHSAPSLDFSLRLTVK